MDFSFTEEQRMMRESVRKAMDRIATPDYVRRLDREQAYPSELYDAWVELGLLRIPFEERLGGLGGSVIDLVIVAEEISRKSADFFMAYAGSVFCGLNVARQGSEEQKRHWLPKLFSGEIKMSISMSEPEAGSDVGAMRTSARREGTDYVISGQKLWATGAGAKGNVINVYVKTDPKANIRQGMSLFLVDNTAKGLELKKLDMLGRRCTGTYEIFFNDVRVPAERLVGGEKGCRPSASPPPRATSARRRPASTSPSNTQRSASSSAERSARTRRSRTCSPTWRPRWRRRAPSHGARRGWRRAAGTRCAKSRWRSSSPPRPT